MKRGELKQFCHRGHDTFDPRGRTNDGQCRLCRNIQAGKYRKACKIVMPKASRIEPKVPWEPLRAALTAKRMLKGIDPTTKLRWAATGIPLSIADHLSCNLLHRHPFEIYGPEWFQMGAA